VLNRARATNRGLATLAISTEAADDEELSGERQEPRRDDDPYEAEAEEIENRVVAPYAEERRNPVWASETERGLRWQFSDLASSSLSTEIPAESTPVLEEVECRSTRCRILLDHADRDAADALQDGLIRGTVFHVPGCRLRSTGYEEHEGGLRQTLYVLCKES
jgi:hypothetical protein